MPEFTGNVTTGQALLHEAFHETVKQSLAGLGYPVFEYDQASGQFRDRSTSAPLGFPVRYPRIRNFLEYGPSHAGLGEIGLSDNVFRADPELVCLVEGFSDAYYGRISTFLIRVSSSSIRHISLTFSQNLSLSDRYFVKRAIAINPKPGVLIVAHFGFNGSSQAGGHSVVRISYNFSNNTASVAQVLYPAYATSTGNTSTYPISKVYAFDAGATMEYFVFVLFTARNTNTTSIRLLRISYNKSNDNISVSDVNVLPNVNDASTGLLLPSFPHGDYSGYNGDHSPLFSIGYLPLNYSLKKGYTPISSLTNLSGNILLQLRGASPWNHEKAVFVKIPFTANINLSNFSSTTVSFNKSQAQVYGPMEIRGAYEDGYLFSDASRIEFRRRSSYNPPNSYRVKTGMLKIPWFSGGAMFVFNNDIDESRLSVTTFGWNRPLDQYRESSANPYVAIINRELTPGGGVYFTGSTFIDQATILFGFPVVDGYPHPLLCLGLVWASDIYSEYTSSFRARISLVVFDSPTPQGVTWGNTLDAKNTQPWLARVNNQDFYAYRRSSSLTDDDKTVYVLDKDLYLTGVMWTNMYQSGFFVPYFQIVRRGGDGIWFDSETLYVGVSSHNPSIVNPSFVFGVNGANVFWYRDASDTSLHYMLGDQVNSTISLVTKLVVSPDRSSLALVGIQGSNDSKFFRLFFFNPEDNLTTSLHYVLPFGSVMLGTQYLNEHVLPFSFSFTPLPYGARTKGKGTNFVIYKDDYNRAKTFFSTKSSNREISFFSYTGITPQGSNISSPIPVIFLESHSGSTPLEGIIGRAVFSLSNPTSALRAIDLARTLRVGDYVTFVDQNGNSYEYVVVNQYDDSFYSSISSTSTTTYRSLLLIRRQ